MSPGQLSVGCALAWNWKAWESIDWEAKKVTRSAAEFVAVLEYSCVGLDEAYYCALHELDKLTMPPCSTLFKKIRLGWG